ncbi:DUF3592 domain-containing protein [Streptomyces sp. NPDC002994]|uniref:DUF3592 domain-containing protein n=1 Tax=Streptomyces sp. NPDC002994 TaxID=3154441 RepID=UPI0033ADF96A
MNVVLVIIGSFVALAGFLYLLSSIPHLVDFLRCRNLERNGIAGEGLCISHAPTADTRTKVFLDIRIPGDGGRTVRVKVLQHGNPTEIGATVPVVYDPRKPQRAKTGLVGVDFDSRSELKVVQRLLTLGLPLCGLGALLVLIA